MKTGKKFVQTIMYNGKKDGSHLETRICVFKQQKEETSLSLVSDPDSLLQALKRAQLLTLVWCIARIKHFRPELYGLKRDSRINSMVPVFFSG